MADETKIVGEAVLRDYPLRLWLQQQEHTDALLREFHLLIGGKEAGAVSSAPEQLLQLADIFTQRFGGLINAINDERHAAVAQGLDRMDSRVPMPDGTPALMEQVAGVFEVVDAYCSDGDLLTLARPPELKALFEWTSSELITQYNGGPSSPWPGPF